MRAAAPVLALGLLAMAVAATSADECVAGHGHIAPDNVTCVCDKPDPAVGESGWTGARCEIPVHGIGTNGVAVSSELKPWEWECWTAETAWDSHLWRYLTVHLSRTSEDGDPDLYGLFFDAEQKNRPRDDFGLYDFSDTSGGNHPVVTARIDKNEVGLDHVFTGTYLCVYAYGANTSYTLQAYTSLCPASYTGHGGAPIECSTTAGDAGDDRHSDGCSATGECKCIGEYQKPVEAVFPGLGFDECSAAVTKLDKNDTVQKWEGAVPADTWHFFQFDVHRHQRHVVVSMGSGAEGDGPALVLKHGSPPGEEYGRYDVRPNYDFSRGHEEGKDKEVVIEGGHWREGTWFAGVHVHGAASGNDTVHLAVSKYKCPRGCSGHGKCVAAKNATEEVPFECDCDSEYYGKDCSAVTTQMTFASTRLVTMTGNEYEYVTLPDVSKEVADANVELRLSFSFTSTEWEPWVTQYPAVLLKHTTDKHEMPSRGNYDYKKVMPGQGATEHIEVCASQLRWGSWRMAVYNPVSFYSINVTIVSSSVARCPGNCTSAHNGECLPTGKCSCKAPFVGADCSIDGDNCPRNSSVVSMMGGGRCLKECKCEPSGVNGTEEKCRYDDKCSDFTCAFSDPPLRRKTKSDFECVTDECSVDVEVIDDGGHFSCLKACDCPKDGAGCTLREKCTPETFKCHYPFMPDSHEKSKLACVERSCEEGTFGDAKKVENGVCLRECVCSEEAGTCAFSKTCRLVCHHGYAKVGDKEPKGSPDAIDEAGKCVKAKGGGGGKAALVGVLMAVVGVVAGAAGLLHHQRGGFDALIMRAQGLVARVRGRPANDDLASAYQGLTDVGDGDEF